LNFKIHVHAQQLVSKLCIWQPEAWRHKCQRDQFTRQEVTEFYN